MEENGAELKKHDLARETPGRELLSRLIDEQGLDAVLNRKSTLYKEMDLGSKKLSKAQALDLMTGNPTLIKRPLVLAGKKAVLGWAPEAYDALLGR